MAGTAVLIARDPPHCGRMSWRIALLFFALGVLTRIPFQTDFLWAHDSVLYARAIERFDPLDHRPQAPGYLYYVLLIRAIDAVVGDPNRAMTIVSLLAGAAAVALLYLFAARLYDERTARASGAFLLTAVTFWAYGGVAYPYTLLAALSIGCAFLFWLAFRAGAGHGWRFALATAAYGIALGFRSDLAVFLAPLWIVAALTAPRLAAVGSAALGAGLVVFWYVASAALNGGMAAFAEALRTQSEFVNEEYSVFGARGLTAVAANTYELARYLGRALYFLGPLLIAVPLSASARRIEASAPRRAAFVVLWTFTPLAMYVPIHVGEYGYVFSMLPGLCVLAARGAIALARGSRMPRTLPWIVATAALANAAIFLVSDSPLSARDLARRDRGVAERIERLNEPDLVGATILAAYDGMIVEHYFHEARLDPAHVVLHYDVARPRRELVFSTRICDRAGNSCREREPVLAVWDDLIRVRGSGWEELRMRHGAKLRVARNMNNVKMVIDGL
ncbi:MAG TPA: glycosyltransferase family 39 protein, partial [Candidatus Limnocylindria bacterium]|nr:glycosyltransferase family 39 protein [Candidatus Limnocylindria bacterium]